MISRQLVLLLSALLVASTIPSSHCYRITLERLDYETGSDENNNVAPQEVSNEVDADLPVLIPVEQDDDETNVVKRDTDAESNNELDVIDNIVNVNNLDVDLDSALPAEDQQEEDNDDDENDDEGVDEAPTPAEAASVSNADSDPVEITNELPTGPGPLTFACRINFLIYDPTCASDGNTYASRYELACAQQEDPSLDRVSCAGEADQAEDEDRFVDNVVSRVARWRTM